MKNILLGFRSLSMKRRSGCPFSFVVCWFYCGRWFRSTSSLSCRAMVLTRLWVSLGLFFAKKKFIFVYWRFFLFCFVEMKMCGDFVPTLW